MKKTTAITTLLIGSLTFAATTGIARASDNEPQPTAPALNAVQALDVANKLKPAQYTSIGLRSGENGQLIYFIESGHNASDSVLVLDANTGKDLTTEYYTGLHPLSEAITKVRSGFDGTVIRAEQSHSYGSRMNYTITLEQEDHQLVFVTVDSKTLKVLSVSEEEEYEEPSGYYY